MSAIDDLVTLCRAYGAALGLGQSALSWRVFGDTKKLSALEAGADIQVRRHEQAMRWLSANWPAGCEWPEGIERPALAVTNSEAMSQGNEVPAA